MIPHQQLKRNIESHLLIEDKNRQLVKFRLNRIQDLYSQSRSNRDIILKARQFGFTSFVLAEYTIEALTVPNTRVVIVAQEKPTAAIMLRKVRTYIERFYDGDEFVKVPMDIESKNELLIKETNSTIYIGTAGSRMFGRGDTVHRLLLTEFAKYDNPDEIFSGIVQAVPASGRIVIETTANGYGSFRDLWYGSKAGQSVFKPMFFPWFMHDEYQLDGVIQNKTPTELAMQAEHPEITDQRLLWYRQKLREINYKGDDPRLMQQEYPATDYEAFIASGNKVFNTTALERLLKQVKPPILIGNVDQFGKFSTDPNGFVHIWKLPQAGKSYVLGGDPSEGLGRGDPAAAVVMERNSAEIVAVWHGHKDPDQFGEDLTGLGRYYKMAMAGPEANNHGIATIIRMRDLGYENMYTRVTYDQTTQRDTKVLGWKTDLKTKPMMIGELKAMVREGQLVIPDERIIVEMLSFEEKEKANIDSEYKKLGAALGAHDDLVIATAIAVQMRKFTAEPSTEELPTSYLRKPYHGGSTESHRNPRR